MEIGESAICDLMKVQFCDHIYAENCCLSFHNLSVSSSSGLCVIATYKEAKSVVLLVY